MRFSAIATATAPACFRRLALGADLLLVFLLLPCSLLITSCGGIGAISANTGLTTTTPSISYGDSATISWSILGATSVTIDNGVGEFTGSSGSATVTPTATTTYTLLASNSAGLFQKSTVKVTVGPQIVSFSASKSSVTSGGSANLTWVITGASSISIDNGVGTVTGNTLSVKPAATTTYTLTATSAEGATSTAKVTVEVIPAPVINSYSASSTLITSGSSITLNWSVSNVATMSIDYGVGTVTGSSVNVTPPSSKTYTLTATNAAGDSVTRSVTVTVVPQPVITTFASSVSTLTSGKSAKLIWATTGASNVSIDNGIGTVTGGSLGVAPTATTTYTITAINAAGTTVSQAVTIQVVPAAKIASFAVANAILTKGNQTTLSWSVSDAATISLDNGIGAVSGSSLSIAPTDTTTYTLTATNSIGDSVTASVLVTVAPVPVIQSFAPASTHIYKSLSTTLNWAVTGATSISLDNGIGAVTGSSLTVQPDTTTTYMLTATNAAGDHVSASTKVVVLADGLPDIEDFSVAKPALTSGKGTTLNWQIEGGVTSISIDNGIGLVTGLTSVPISPTATTTYTITAVSTVGKTNTAHATVTVYPEAAITGFTPAVNLLVSGTATTLNWSVANAEHVKLSASDGSVSQDVTSSTPPFSVTPISLTSVTYTLTATNPAGDSVSATAPLNVLSIGLFASNFTTLIKGQNKATISWAVNNAASITLSSTDSAYTDAAQSASSSITVQPATATGYTLTAKATDSLGQNLSVTSTVNLAVRDTLGIISSFLATPAASTSIGGTTSLLPVFADSVDVYGNAYTAVIINDVDSNSIDVASQNNVAQPVTVNSTPTNYTLKITDAAAGVTESRSLRVVAGDFSIYSGIQRAFGDCTSTSYSQNFKPGLPSEAKYCGPTKMVRNSDGDVLFADYNANVIVKINHTNHESSIYAGVGGQSTATNAVPASATFWNPKNLAIDASNNLYVTGGDCAVRKIPADSTQPVTTLAGVLTVKCSKSTNLDGVGTLATIPWNTAGIVLDSAGDLIVASPFNLRVVAMDGTVTTIAGYKCTSKVLCSKNDSPLDGVGTGARFNSISSIAIDANDVIYVADRYSIRKVTPTKCTGCTSAQWTWNVTTWTNPDYTAGHVDGPVGTAKFGGGKVVTNITSLALDTDGTLYVGEGYYLRRITPDGMVQTLAGNGTVGTLDTVYTSTYFPQGPLPGTSMLAPLPLPDPENHQLLFISYGSSASIYAMPY